MCIIIDKCYGYQIVIRAGGRQFRKPVETGDMASAQEQTRFEADRQGKLPVDDFEVSVGEEPEFAVGGGSLSQASRCPSGKARQHLFADSTFHYSNLSRDGISLSSFGMVNWMRKMNRISKSSQRRSHRLSRLEFVAVLLRSLRRT